MLKKCNFNSDVEWRDWVTFKLGQQDIIMRIVLIILAALVGLNAWGVIRP